MACIYAQMTDRFNGWECTITQNACLYLHPDFDLCDREYGSDLREYDSLGVIYSDNRFVKDGELDWDKIMKEVIH